MPDVNRYYDKEAMGTGGWIGALLELLKSRRELEIGVVAACGHFLAIFYRFFKKKVNDWGGTVKPLGQMNANQIAEELCKAHIFVSASYT